MKIKRLLTAALMLCVITFTACEKESAKPDEEQDKDQVSQDDRFIGMWKMENGNVFLGTSGALKFQSVKSSSWSQALSSKLISVGDLYLKNFVKESENTWKCEAMWNKSVDGDVKEVKYSSQSKIKLSSDGKRLTLTSTSPFTGEVSSGDLTRQ